MRERESFFNEYIVEVRRREKDEKQAKKEQVCVQCSQTPVRPFVVRCL